MRGQVGCDGGDDADPQLHSRAARIPRGVLQRPHLGQHRLGVGQHRAAKRRQRQPRQVPIQQRAAQSLLQLPDLGRKRRLRHRHLRRRLAEMPRAGEGLEIAQLPLRDTHNGFFMTIGFSKFT